MHTVDGFMSRRAFPTEAKYFFCLWIISFAAHGSRGVGAHAIISNHLGSFSIRDSYAMIIFDGCFLF